MKEEIFLLKKENVKLLMEEVVSGPENLSILTIHDLDEVLEYFNDEKIRKQCGITYSEVQEGFLLTPDSLQKFVNMVTSKLLDKGIVDLINEGLIDVVWDDKLKEFVFTKTENGS